MKSQLKIPGIPSKFAMGGKPAQSKITAWPFHHPHTLLVLKTVCDGDRIQCCLIIHHCA
jgi:hypothetical protein